MGGMGHGVIVPRRGGVAGRRRAADRDVVAMERASLPVMVGLTARADPSKQGLAAPSPPSSSEASATASLIASAAPEVPSLEPAKLARKTTPKDRRLADEKACEGGDSSACRRAADRYRGYGHIAGCGVD